MRAICIILLLLGANVAWSQATIPDQKPTAQGMLVLPTQMGNPLFDRLTSPLGELDLSVQVPLKYGLGVGVGGRIMAWELKKNAFSQISTLGEARRLAFYGKVQYARYTGPKTFYEINGKLGTSTWTWDCSTCEENVKQQGLHWSGTAGYFVHATDNLAFGITVGYESDATEFSPEVICQDEFPGYTDRGGPYHFLVVGLGFSTRFEKSKEERW